MAFLPIAERELRVSSRKRSTFTTRALGALLALVIGSGIFVLWRYAFRGPSAQLGTTLFAVLSWLCLAASLSVGLFFTSDCLSEEKREGTLGFLFLTDLRGYDVIVGKLLAGSLRGFYALLAILPVISITLLMGGVAGAVFWKTSLALLNAVFISLVAGLLVSDIQNHCLCPGDPMVRSQLHWRTGSSSAIDSEGLGSIQLNPDDGLASADHRRDE